MTTSQLEPYYREVYKEQVRVIVAKIVQLAGDIAATEDIENDLDAFERGERSKKKEFLHFLTDLVGVSFSDGRVHPGSGEIPSGDVGAEGGSNSTSEVHREAGELSS